MPARNSATFVDPRTQGLRDTRWALKRWDADPGPVLGTWFNLRVLVVLALLAAMWLISLFAQTDPASVSLGGPLLD